jgi:hypothetical protein
MATKPKAAKAAPDMPAGMVKARVLVEGAHGKVNDVVVVDQALIDAMQERVAADATKSTSAELDADPAAVAYAESIAPPPAEDE